jgi:hypothetical protein
VPEASKKDIANFYTRAYDKFKRTLYDGLTSLQRRRLIDFKDEWHIRTCADKTIVASDKQYEIIEFAELRALKQMGLEKIQHVYLTNRVKNFKFRVGKIIENLGWDFYYKQIKIAYTGVFDVQKTPINKDIERLKIELNDLLIQYINKQAEKDAQRADASPEQHRYIDVQKRLAESLLRIPQNIKNESEVNDDERQQKA